MAFGKGTSDGGKGFSLGLRLQVGAPRTPFDIPVRRSEELKRIKIKSIICNSGNPFLWYNQQQCVPKTLFLNTINKCYIPFKDYFGIGLAIGKDLKLLR